MIKEHRKTHQWHSRQVGIPALHRAPSVLGLSSTPEQDNAVSCQRWSSTCKAHGMALQEDAQLFMLLLRQEYQHRRSLHRHYVLG